ncbi:MAG: PilZ domain-containing protein [Magnetococcales bacterium]|nr:PilZ domain-containing protein [Magnetococcales bacterium]
MSEKRPPPARVTAHRGDFYEVRDPEEITRLLTDALLSEETVEVVLNDHPRAFFTRIIDHPPAMGLAQLVMWQEAMAKNTLDKESYRPMSYLRQRERLTVAALVPAEGAAQAAQSETALIRFFQNVKAVEGTVQFRENVKVLGEPAMVLTFPSALRVQRQRRHYRARIIYRDAYRLTVEKEGHPPFTTPMLDVSVGGVSFCNPQGPDALPLESPLRLTLQVAGGSVIRMTAFVRNHFLAMRKQGCGLNQGRCGVQFDIMSEQAAAQVEEVVARVQRDLLQLLQRKRDELGR